MKEIKQLIRQRFLQIRKNYPSGLAAKASAKITDFLIESDYYKKSNHIHIYYSKREEVSTPEIIKKSFDFGKKVVVPVIQNKKIMEHVEIFKDTQFKEASFGISEPLVIHEYFDVNKLKSDDIILIPLVAFDHQLGRLGHGKGYYDMFLSKTKALKVGLAYSWQQTNEVPMEKFDVYLDLVITENSVMTKNNSGYLDEEYVVLVDEENQVVGTTPKSGVHQLETPRHRGFSSFIFNSKGELLLQQRSKSKKTWPLVWSNTCCGHPKLEETSVEAAYRRLNYELGLKIDNLEEIIPDYKYCFTRYDVMENEFCPVIVGFSDQEAKTNPDEVEAVKWIKWENFLDDIRKNPQDWSEWCIEEAELLEKSPRFRNLFEDNTSI
jgi:isopentenyl-diphosphate Delta-isomerase